MPEPHVFYLWSLSEAWHWLINVPVIGFIALFVLAIPTALLVFFLLYEAISKK